MMKRTISLIVLAAALLPLAATAHDDGRWKIDRGPKEAGHPQKGDHIHTKHLPGKSDHLQLKIAGHTYVLHSRGDAPVPAICGAAMDAVGRHYKTRSATTHGEPHRYEVWVYDDVSDQRREMCLWMSHELIGPFDVGVHAGAYHTHDDP